MKYVTLLYAALVLAGCTSTTNPTNPSPNRWPPFQQLAHPAPTLDSRAVYR